MSIPSPSSLTDALHTLRDTLDAAGAVERVDAALDALTPAKVPGLGGEASVPDMSPEALAKYFDHTQLRPSATDADVDHLIEEAEAHGFASVCVAPTYVTRAAAALDESSVDVCTVIGFPHGNHTPDTKAFEARRAIEDGAAELDVVLNVGALKSGRYDDVEADLRAVVEVTEEADESALVKVIFETALLTPAEIAVACVIAERAGAAFVKTSTGFAATGATLPDVALMRQVVDDAMGVKASGGVGDLDTAYAMIGHGATRIGASGSVGIIEEATSAEATP